MTLEQRLRSAPIEKLTLFYHKPRGEWQASAQRIGETGFVIGIDADPVTAIQKVFAQVETRVVVQNVAAVGLFD